MRLRLGWDFIDVGTREPQHFAHEWSDVQIGDVLEVADEGLMVFRLELLDDEDGEP